MIEALVIGALTYVGVTAHHTNSTKMEALNHALSYVGTKGMVNLGSGCGHQGSSMNICLLPQVIYNVDTDGVGPKALYADLETGTLPFAYREFDVAFSAHILEHLGNWEGALTEWCRIADHVVIVLPHPASIGGWVHPRHVNHFGYNDMKQMVETHRNLEVFA